MTENRFDYTAYDDGTESIYDRKKDEYYFDMQLSQIEELMNELADENEQLKQENLQYKSLLQDMGMLMSDDEIKGIRNEISDKLLKPLFKSNGFDVDIDTDNGFTIIPKGDVE